MLIVAAFIVADTLLGVSKSVIKKQGFTSHKLSRLIFKMFFCGYSKSRLKDCTESTVWRRLPLLFYSNAETIPVPIYNIYIFIVYIVYFITP